MIVLGITIIPTPIMLTQSASIIAFLLPYLFKQPENNAPKKPPINTSAVINGIKKSSSEPQCRVEETQG